MKKDSLVLTWLRDILIAGLLIWFAGITWWVILLIILFVFWPRIVAALPKAPWLSHEKKIRWILGCAIILLIIGAFLKTIFLDLKGDTDRVFIQNDTGQEYQVQAIFGDSDTSFPYITSVTTVRPGERAEINIGYNYSADCIVLKSDALEERSMPVIPGRVLDSEGARTSTYTVSELLTQTKTCPMTPKGEWNPERM